MTFETIFDISQQAFKNAWFPAMGLIFVAIGLFLILGRVLTQRFNLKLLPLFLGKRKAFDWFYLIFGLLWTSVTFLGTYQAYKTALSDFQEGRYSTVEGRVTGFVPMPDGGHGKEHFSVAGQHFSYSDYSMTPGFNNSSVCGGPVREGLYVRIAHSGNLILRLEIAQ